METEASPGADLASRCSPATMRIGRSMAATIDMAAARWPAGMATPSRGPMATPARGAAAPPTAAATPLMAGTRMAGTRMAGTRMATTRMATIPGVAATRMAATQGTREGTGTSRR